MRHGNAYRKLSRTASHRRALLRNLATSLILHESLVTTLPKAKELRPVVERLVTLGKRKTLHAQRQAMSYLWPVNRHATGNANKLTPVHRLFTEIAPRYAERNGGYLRIIRTHKRPGDNAQMAVIQFVEATIVSKEPAKRKRRVGKRTATEGAADAATES